MVDWLNVTAVTMFGTPTSWAELLGFGTGMLCVLLVVRQHVANWPVREMRGPHEVRLAAALSACDALLAQGWQLAPPLGQSVSDRAL